MLPSVLTPMVKVPREEMSTAPSFISSGSFIRLMVGLTFTWSISLPVSVRSTGAKMGPINTNRNMPTRIVSAMTASGFRKKRLTASFPGLS